MCGFEAYTCCIFAAISGIVQSLFGLALSIIGLLLYNCVLQVKLEDTPYSRFFFPLYLEYFYKPKMCSDRGLTTLPTDVFEMLLSNSTSQLTSPNQVKVWMGGYIVCNNIWLLASLVLLYGLTKNRKVTYFFFWLAAAGAISVVDLVATIIFSLDVKAKLEGSHSVWEEDYSMEYDVKVICSFVVLPALFSRLVVIWFINVFLIYQVFRAMRLVKQGRPLRQNEVIQEFDRSRQLLPRHDNSKRIPRHSATDQGHLTREQTSHYRSREAPRQQYRSSVPDIIPTHAGRFQDVNIPSEPRGSYQDVTPEHADRFQNPGLLLVQGDTSQDVYISPSHQGRQTDVHLQHRDGYHPKHRQMFQGNTKLPDSRNRTENRQDSGNRLPKLISDDRTALKTTGSRHLSEDNINLHPTTNSLPMQGNIPKSLGENRRRSLINNEGNYHRYSLSLDKSDGRRKYHRLSSIPSSPDKQSRDILYSSQPRGPVAAGPFRPRSFSVEGGSFSGVDFRNKNHTQVPNQPSNRRKSSLTSGPRPLSQELRKEFPWTYLTPSSPQSPSVKPYSVDPVFFHNPAMDIEEEVLQENNKATYERPEEAVHCDAHPVTHVSSPLNDPRPKAGYADPWDLRDVRRNVTSSSRHRMCSPQALKTDDQHL